MSSAAFGKGRHSPAGILRMPLCLIHMDSGQGGRDFLSRKKLVLRNHDYLDCVRLVKLFHHM
jgi:hypothetical protein